MTAASLPDPELDEDVRRHVARVARLGRNPRVRARDVERLRGVLGVVVVVEQVVGGAWMVGVAAAGRGGRISPARRCVSLPAS